MTAKRIPRNLPLSACVRLPNESSSLTADVKGRLETLDGSRLELITLPFGRVIRYPRLYLGEHVLEPYKKTLARWLWPDPFRNQDTSVSTAKQAISHYKKAVGDPAGLTELMVFYCEQAAGYCQDIGYQEEGFFDALVRMFEQALKSDNTLHANGQESCSSTNRRWSNLGRPAGFLVRRHSRRGKVAGETGLLLIKQ